MQAAPDKQDTNTEKELDLGILMAYISAFFKKLLFAVIQFFVILSEGFFAFLLFIKRNLVWLIIGVLLGAGISLYFYFKNGPLYKTTMVVRTNFESSRLLYNKIEYLNSLLKNYNTKQVAAILNISAEEAGNIGWFSIEPVQDEIQQLTLYKNFFYRIPELSGNRDSIFSRTISYQQFKKQLTPYNFPLHQITLNTSRQEGNFSGIGQALVAMMNENKTLRHTNDVIQSLYKDQEAIVTKSLQGLDSLRQAYYNRISSGYPPGTGESRNLILSETPQKVPELDLYDKELQLKNELTNIRINSTTEQGIVQVIADFNNATDKKPFFEQVFSWMTYFPVIIIFIILAGIEFLKLLNRIEKKKH